MSRDFREFLRLAKEAGPDFYVEVKRPLKPELEVGVLQMKLARDGRYPVIYCPEIEGSKLPLVSNVFGSYQLLGLALGLNPKKATNADILREYRKRRSETMPLQSVPALEAPVKEVILRGKDVDLGLLPINRHAELNSGKYIPIGYMICKDPDSGMLNVGIYRHEVKGKAELSAMLIPSHHASHYARRYAALGRPMEVAIFIGHHPAISSGSLSTGGPPQNELERMGSLLGEPFRVTPAETVDLPIPAHAEIVIEGIIDTDPRHMVTDGPFSEWQGYYGREVKCYLMKVTGITMRKDAIYHDLFASQREHNLVQVLAKTSAVYDAVKSVVPTVKAVYLPFPGRCSRIAYVSLAQRVPGEAMRAALAAVNSMNPTTIVVVVDEDIDVSNEEEVLWAIATRTTPDLDIATLTRLLGDPLCPTSYDETRSKRGTMISKVLINATKPVELPFPTRVTPPENLWNSMKLEDYIR